MLLSKLRIRGKIALLVVIPLLATIGLAAPLMLDRVRQADRAATTAERARLARHVSELIQGLQQERLLLFGTAFRATAPAQLSQEVETNEETLARLRTDPLVANSASMRAALDNVDDLAPLLRPGKPRAFKPDKVVLAFGEIVGRLIDAMQLQAGMDAGTSAGRQMMALDASLRSDEAISVTSAYALLVGATNDPGAVALYFAGLASVSLLVDRFKLFATKDQKVRYAAEEQKVRDSFGPAFSAKVGADPRPLLRKIPVAMLVPMLLAINGKDRKVSNSITVDVEDEVGRVRDRELRAAYLVGVGVLVLILLVMLLCVLVARQVVRPLTRLTDAADRIARLTQDELVRVADDEVEVVREIRFDPVVVEARDEVGDLARAFERMQGTAVSLVRRQVNVRRNVAQMFGHVGRRTQNLVARQASVIARLASQDSDPARRDELLRLDHVANRLRRNASSLVVLSGENSADERVSPVALIDVLRLALAEVEQQHRVDLEIPGELALVPAVINDLVLVFAEIIENATVFSPPDSRVTVTADRSERGVTVSVIDHGIGMGDAQRATENGRLRQRERLDLAPTGVLGLFVVGRLARRHGLLVILAGTPGGGTTVTVEIRRALLSKSAAPLRLTLPAPRAVPEPIRRRRAHSSFDTALLERACQLIADGGSWRAFATSTVSPWAEPMVIGTVASAEVPTVKITTGSYPGEETTLTMTAPNPAALWASTPAISAANLPVLPAARTPLDDDLPTRTPVPVGAGEPRGIADAPFTLDRRVPGATLSRNNGLLPQPARGRAAVSAAPMDADAVRDLVQQFESGVVRALNEDVTNPSIVEGTRS